LNAAPKDADLATLRPAELPQADADRVMFEIAATWPDIIRSTRSDSDKARNAKYHHGPWHYYDVFIEQDASGKITERADIKNADENALVAYDAQRKVLASPTASAEEKAVAIAWLEHLVGDTHMPLHNVARITPEEPKNDQGGNAFKLGPKPDTGYQPNLHAFWDDIPDVAFPRNPGETPYARVGRIAEMAKAAMPKNLFDRAGMLQEGRFATWNREGAEIALSRVYPGVKRGELPNSDYTYEATQTSLVALAKAGYRLAATLEAALADTK
ncbi:MAG: S1/P1 nuclease, partial [Armatimonadetes bacterium]|nr:S1/P1 nuclease [Armatimonadota bacterium]